MLNSGRCKQGFINENGRCVADNYGVGHKNQASCSYIEAGAVVELSDSTFIQMLQVRSRPSSPPRFGTPRPFQKMGMKEYASLAKSSCCPFRSAASNSKASEWSNEEEPLLQLLLLRAAFTGLSVSDDISSMAIFHLARSCPLCAGTPRVFGLEWEEAFGSIL